MTKQEMLEGLRREIEIKEADLLVMEASIEARKSVARWAADQELHAKTTEGMVMELDLHTSRLNVLQIVAEYIDSIEE